MLQFGIDIRGVRDIYRALIQYLVLGIDHGHDRILSFEVLGQVLGYSYLSYCQYRNDSNYSDELLWTPLIVTNWITFLWTKKDVEQCSEVPIPVED